MISHANYFDFCRDVTDAAKDSLEEAADHNVKLLTITTWNDFSGISANLLFTIRNSRGMLSVSIGVDVGTAIMRRAIGRGIALLLDTPGDVDVDIDTVDCVPVARKLSRI